MNEYSFTLPYPPSNNRYCRHSRGFHYISKVGKEYREQVRDIIELLTLTYLADWQSPSMPRRRITGSEIWIISLNAFLIALPMPDFGRMTGKLTQ